MLLRCTGRVLRVDAREGTATRTGKPYRIPFAVVLIADSGVAEVNVPETLEYQIRPGDDCDWLVEVGAFGNTPQARYVSNIAALGLAHPADVPPSEAA